MSVELEVFSDLSEELNYNLPDFPLYVRKGALNHFDKYAAACHWHQDLEFILVLDGEMEYFVNGEIVLIERGNGIFVNSKRMHYGFSTKKLDCTFIVVVIHPSLLGVNTHVGKVYWDEKFGSNTEDYIMITSQSTWGKEIVHSLHRIYEEMNSTPCKPLRLLSLATSLCADVGDHIQRVPGQINDEQSWIAVWKMTGFIHHNFDLRVTLDDIATAGSVCRSKCCELFGTYIGQTPNTYLVQYRIQKSYEMLMGTNRSICEIAMNCGFQSASYFSSVFRNKTGLTPQNYRKKVRTPSHSY